MNKIDEMIRELCPEGVKRVKLGEVAVIGTGSSNRQDASENGRYPFFVRSKDILHIDNYEFDEEAILIPGEGGIGDIFHYYKGKYGLHQRTYRIAVSSVCDCKYVYYYMYSHFKTFILSKAVTGSVSSIRKTMIDGFEIPLPPLAIQQEIVSILDSFSSLQSKLEEELAVRQKQMEFYREKLLTFDKDDNSVKWMKLGEVGDVCMCRRILKQQTSTDGEIPFYKIGTFGKLADAYISDELYREYKEKYKFPKKGEILISAAGTIGRTVVYDGEPAYFQDSNIVWISNDEKNVYNTFLSYVYSVAKWDVDNGGVVARLYNSNISRTIIPVPPLSRQQEIVLTLDTMSSLIDKLKEEIELRKKQYEYYREALLSF